VKDPNATEYVYHFPPPGDEFAMMVRQVQLVGADRVGGRWSAVNMTLQPTLWHMKDLDDPGQYSVAFDSWAEDEPSFSHKAASEQLRPWGSKKSVELVSEERSSEGGFMLKYHSDSGSDQQAIRMIRKLHDRRRGVCLLTTRPNRKFFVALQDIGETGGHLPWHTEFNISWREALYIEDIYRRESERVPRGYREDN
jgi:hypothetical protein